MTSRSPTFVGHLIGASFGLVFVLVNAAGLPAVLGVALRITAVAAFAVVLAGFLHTVRDLRAAGGAPPAGFTRFFWLVVLIEAVALVGGLAVIRQVEPAAALGWIALVVGLHFFPLARLWPEGRRQLQAIATAMTALGVIGLVLAFTTRDAVLVAVVSGVGSGLVLLGWSLVQAVETLAGRRSGAAA
jgi:hypothetical protein